ncbi:MAG: CocE/NonD family hydrolase [Bacilli bacterium]|nr:CocE/NonD family hydrolase [Bacilli bacterium]
MPNRNEKIENITYPDGRSCDVIFTKMMEPISKEEYTKISDEEKMNYCIEVPLKTTEFYVDDEHKVICLQDQPIRMRDGIKIYADIYLPVTALDGPVPLIVSWSLYGKQPWHQQFQLFQAKKIPSTTISPMCKFNSADPMYWCYLGYGVANVDPRGIGNSEGDQQQFGTQDARDGYDFIEWAAKQKWCNGKISLFGSSGAAMSIWKIAAEQPPHLACIAPWDGAGDLYRESIMEGGIPGFFGSSIAIAAQGKGYIDNTLAMAKKEPFVTSPYWQDKIPKYEKITVPVYTTCNWNDVHSKGSWEGFQKVSSEQKWMRTHQAFEAEDLYNPKVLQDITLFFERFLKNIHNGWELTPKIRLEVMDAYTYSFEKNREETTWPLARTNYKKLYLNASNGKLGDLPVKNESSVMYDSKTGLTTFEYTFRKETELTGNMKLRIWVEAKNHNEMDLFVTIKKLSAKGEVLPITILGNKKHPGAWGKLRVSQRHLDEKQSSEHQPIYTFDQSQKLIPGEIVPVDIEIWPSSRVWHKGQKLQIEIAGRYTREDWFEPLEWFTDNNGEHIIHTGGQYESYLVIPEIPPRYEDGEYTFR